MSINRWMNEDSVVHIHMASSVINKNEMTFTEKKNWMELEIKQGLNKISQTEYMYMYTHHSHTHAYIHTHTIFLI